MALLFFSDYMLTPSSPKSPSVRVLLEAAQGAAVTAMAMLPSGGELPTGALPVPSPSIITGMNAHSQRQMVA